MLYSDTARGKMPVMHASVAPLLVLSIILVVGLIAGMLAKKIHLPAVSGQILAGILLASLGLPFFSVENLHAMRPVTDFALGLIAVTVGSHLYFKRLRNAYKRLLLMVLFEISITPLLVFAAVYMVGNSTWTTSLLFGFLAVSTAPATVVALVKETRSKGVFVKTLLGAVALNNMAAIALFEIAHVIARINLGPHNQIDVLHSLLAPMQALALSALLGGGVGLISVLVSRKIVSKDKLASVSAVSILFASGVAESLGLSSLLSCLFLGMAFANLAPDKDEVGHGVFATFEHGIYAVFFTLAGLELELQYIIIGGPLAVLLVLARGLGKTSSAWLAMRLAGATQRTRRYLGPALIPQTGLAVGQILLIQNDPGMHSIAQIFLAVGITSVAINESIGPLFTRLALTHSGSAEKDRARVIDFIHEQNIVTDFYAATKEQAVEKLVDLMIASHHVKMPRQALIESVLQREDEMSTCLGQGLAIPHGVLDEGEQILGVMGVNSQGLPFKGPDGIPVQCIVLLATPPSRRDHHLKVLGVLARAIGADRMVQAQIYHAKTPAHVYEILHVDDASQDFNYFLERPDTD